MRELKQYVKQANTWNAIFNGPQYNLGLAEDRQRLASHIDSALSPENLTCDGEIRGEALRVKYNRLKKVAQQLKTLDPSVSFYEY